MDERAPESPPRLFITKYFLALGACLYLASFILPVMRISAAGDELFGFQAFYGCGYALFASLFTEALGWAWVANPLCWLGFYAFIKKLHGYALALALAAVAFSTIMLFLTHGESLLYGYYIWVASIALIASAASIEWQRQRKHRHGSCRGFEVIVEPMDTTPGR